MFSRPIDRRTVPGATPAFGQLLLGQLRVRRRGRVDDEGLRVADVGNHRQELHAVRESPAGLVPALDDEGEQAARAQRRVLLAQLVVGGGLQARVVDGFDVRVCLQEVGDRQRVGDVTLDAQ